MDGTARLPRRVICDTLLRKFTHSLIIPLYPAGSMFLKWLPWKYLLRHAARRYKILDPITFLARLRRFAQPSEIQEPIELLRAGILFHARGLINTKAIQYNLDWIWPFWVEKQFNPEDPSFIPRGFSFSHVNLTHRNWTAVGAPDTPLYPIVDPRGLVTPDFDGWSLDFWILAEDGRHLFPSRTSTADQRLCMTDNLAVETACKDRDLSLVTEAALEENAGRPELAICIKGSARAPAWVAAAIRPYNPEGIQFVEKIAYLPDETCLTVNHNRRIHMSEPPERVIFSDYRTGDAAHRIHTVTDARSVACDIGMATAAALFRIPETGSKKIQIRVPLENGSKKPAESIQAPARTWGECFSDTPRLEIPDEKIRFLFDAALRTLLLLSADDVVPGPYTYRRFWFRDACFMLNALMAAGFLERAYGKLETFPLRQKRSGYFLSQEGEWDSNGQALWILHRYHALSGRPLSKKLMKAVDKGARWIIRKRTPGHTDALHAGLLPAGFSAEHLGPNDYYYWDNFWGLAGLKAAAALAASSGSLAMAAQLEKEALDFENRIFTSIDAASQNIKNGAVPASGYRRMDAGAVGSLVADYPLRITPPGDSRFVGTVEYLMENCFQKGAFFQDMIHSGINAYLTLAIAQTLLRARDPRYRRLIRVVADLASPTGNWPEAIHPHTGGGCMGDGHHGWAAAEWFMMIRNLFVREEDDTVVLGSGIFPEWLKENFPVRFGPTWTPKGRITFAAEKIDGQLHLSLETEPKDGEFDMIAAIPGFKTQTVPSRQKHITVEEDAS